MSDREVWIALVELRQRPGANVLLDRNKAFSNVLALAANEDELRTAAREAAHRVGFELMHLEEAEPLRARRNRSDIGDELDRLAHEVMEKGEARFDAMYTWISDDRQT